MIRTLDELTDLERISLIEISASRLSSFARCESAYFYDYILFEPRGHNKYSLLGNVVHSVLENTDFNKPLDFFDMRNLFEDYRAHFDPDNEITQDLIDVGYEILAEFCRSRQEDKWHVVEKEAEFAIVIGPALVVGYIDRIDEIGNCIIISDYKTGKNEVAAKNVPYDFQLGIYALAMKKRFPDKRIIAQFDYLRSGKIKAHEFTDSDLADMEEKLIAAINGIINTKDFKPTSNKYFCKWCNHAESHDGKPPACTIGAKRVGNLT